MRCMYLTPKFSSGKVLYKGSSSSHHADISCMAFIWARLVVLTKHYLVVLCVVYSRWLVLYFLSQFVCVTQRNYTSWIVQAFPSSSVSKYPNLNVQLHNNPSSATWLVCSEEAEIFGLWKTQCSFVPIWERIYLGLEQRAFVLPLQKSHIK